MRECIQLTVGFYTLLKTAHKQQLSVDQHLHTTLLQHCPFFMTMVTMFLQTKCLKAKSGACHRC